MILFWRLSMNLNPVYFSPAARGEPVCRWVSRDFAAIVLRLQVEREGGDFVVASFNQFTPCLFFAGCAGGTGLTAGL